jgi:anti-sigma factor (TIGR02949 family)
MNGSNFRPKQCEQIRQQLDAYLSNELLMETTREVLGHLESCEECSHELESRMQVREALRKAVAKEQPPNKLREEVQRRLRKAHPGFWGDFLETGWAVALAGLAVVVLAGVIGQQWLRLQEGRRIVKSVLSLGVSDHLNCAIKGHNYHDEGSSLDQLREKLGPEYAGLLDVVQQRLPGFQLLEAHQCSVPGSPRKYVHFILRGHGTILSVILTKKEGENLVDRKLLVARTSSGVNLYKDHLNGMDVAGFQTNGYFGFVVSDLGQNEMLQIAAGLAPAIRSAFPAIVDTLRHEVSACFFAAIWRPGPLVF